ncbi:MAG: FixH family protein [Pseudomonadota bacterium]
MQKAFEIKGRHVLIAFVAFFGVIISVNTVFITMAVRTFSGEEVPKSYLQGLNYNETLAERARQAALGWTAVAGFEAAPDGGQRLVIAIEDRGGAPVRGLTVSGVVKRPVFEREDVAFAAAPEGSGYAARLAALAPGIWEIDGAATAADGSVFEFIKRVRID